MTSSKMENPLWKKLQNDPTLLKYQTQAVTNNEAIGIESYNMIGSKNATHLNPNDYLTCDSGGGIPEAACSNASNSEFANFSSNNSMSSSSSYQKLNGSNNNQLNKQPYQQQQQQQSSSYASLVDHQNQQLQQLQQFINLQKSNSQTSLEQFNQLESMQLSYNTASTNSTNASTNNLNGNNSYFYDLVSKSGNGSGAAKSAKKRELGVVEKLVGSYGFVKCLDRDGRLFFHCVSFQSDSQTDVPFKIGELIEFEEGVDKRNGKPIATNIIRFQQNSQDISSRAAALNFNNSQQQQQQQQQQQMNADSLNLYNLKELLLKTGKTSESQPAATAAYNYASQQQNYQTIMNGLKMLNMQNVKNNDNPTGNGFNANVLNLFNKENIFNNANNNLSNQINVSNNILNMVKSASAAAAVSTNIANDTSNLNNLAKILNMNEISSGANGKKPSANNEQQEGTIAIVATKRPITSNYNGNANYISPQLDGRITYQRSGETFYIPYSLSDVIPSNTNNIQLKVGDRVRFYIAQSLGSSNQLLPIPVGTYYARHVELVTQSNQLNFIEQNQRQPKQLYRGVITTLKDSFGKIEREDLFKETFFHFTEYRGQNANQELKLGLNVEFELQDRHGKEIACNIKMLPDGTVSFDELSRNVYIGRIIQPLTKIANLVTINKNMAGINLNSMNSIGRLIYDNNSNTDDSLAELIFGELDRLPGTCDYTLLEGDFVQFRVATDKRKKNSFSLNSNQQLHRQQRATQLTLIEEHSLVENSINTNEYRERGVLVKVGTAKELLPNVSLEAHQTKFKFGAIKCLEQNELVYFCFDEVINYVKFCTNASSTSYTIREVDIQLGDSLEFTVIKCQKEPIFKNGLKAIRVKLLPKNSVQFEIIGTEIFTGFIDRELITSGNSEKNHGQIRVDSKNNSAISKTITFGSGANQDHSSSFYFGDKVQFNLATCIKTKKQTAINIKLIESAKEQGYISVLKENYGLIEIVASKNQKHGNKSTLPREIFFQTSSLIKNDIEIGDEVEFIINRKNPQKFCAESIGKIKSGTIKPNNIESTIYKGRIIQQLKPHNPTISAEQTTDDTYYGKLQLISANKKDSKNDAIYQYGLYALSDKKQTFQVGDQVSFQLGSLSDGAKKTAFNIQQSQNEPQRTRASSVVDIKKGKIDSIKGHCGYIEYSMGSDPKKVFFHISDLMEGGSTGSSESSNIRIGDEVEFTLSHNSRNGKFSAIKIKKLSSSKASSNENNQKSAGNNANATLSHVSSTGSNLNEQEAVAKRPEHLITKLKINNIDDKSGKQLILTRQPNNPDGKQKSFSRELIRRLPGSFEPLPSVEGKSLIDSKTTDASEATSNTVSSLSIIDLLMAANTEPESVIFS